MLLCANPPIILGSNDRLRTPSRTPNTLLGQPNLVPSLAQPSFATTNVLPFRTRVAHGLRSVGQTMLQPRLAMTAAMAFFSIALTLNLTGIRITNLRASDLKPSSIMRSAYEAKARVVRYSDNLRVVYELESRVRELQGSSDDNNGSSNSPAPQNDPAAGQQPNQNPDQNQKPGSQKPGSQKQDQKQTKPNPGSSRRETPSGSIQLVESVRPQATPLFAKKSFVVLNPSIKQEGGLA